MYPWCANARSALLPNLRRSLDAPMTATVRGMRSRILGVRQSGGGSQENAVAVSCRQFDVAESQPRSSWLESSRGNVAPRSTAAVELLTEMADCALDLRLSLPTLLRSTYAHALRGARRPDDRRRRRNWSRPSIAAGCGAHACGHACPIPDGAAGVCKVRFNRGGVLYVPFGYVGGVQCDPIEKKPFFHARPGALAFSFGMLGCDLHCSYCQNWVTSQALRDPQAVTLPRDSTPAALVAEATRLGARAIVSTYNEPLITSEWSVAIFKQARAAGLMTAFVSNGNATPRVLDYLRPWVDLYKVDLKSFDDRHYRQLGGRLEPVLATIRALHEMDIWLEIVTLLIPGFNDSAG